MISLAVTASPILPMLSQSVRRGRVPPRPRRLAANWDLGLPAPHFNVLSQTALRAQTRPCLGRSAWSRAQDMVRGRNCTRNVSGRPATVASWTIPGTSGMQSCAAQKILNHFAELAECQRCECFQGSNGRWPCSDGGAIRPCFAAPDVGTCRQDLQPFDSGSCVSSEGRFPL